MPLFFFDYYDKDERDLDTDGIEFPDMEAAYLDAYHSAIDMWAEARHEGRDVSHHRFEIRDATGNIVVVLPFTEVLKGAKEPQPFLSLGEEPLARPAAGLPNLGRVDVRLRGLARRSCRRS